MIKISKKNFRNGFIVLIVVFFSWRLINLFIKPANNMGYGRNRVVPVEVSEISIEPMKEIKTFTGSIYPAYQYELASKVTGRIEKFDKRIGDYVKKNEVIAILNKDEYEQAVIEAQADLTIADANLVNAQSQYMLAKKELDRTKALQGKNYISAADFETANADFITAESHLTLSQAQVEQKKAVLRQAEIKLEQTILRAPETGYIGERFSDIGNLVSVGTPVVSVVGIDSLILKSNLVEKLYGSVAPGMEVEIKVDAFQNQVFQGVVSRISPVIQSGSRTAEMEMVMANPEHKLKPGMFCKIDILLQEKINAQVVPNHAIIRKNGNVGIFVLEEEKMKAKYIDVTLGIITDKKSEIVEPEITNKVITVGQYQLKDGSEVVLPGEHPKGKKSPEKE